MLVFGAAADVAVTADRVSRRTRSPRRRGGVRTDQYEATEPRLGHRTQHLALGRGRGRTTCFALVVCPEIPEMSAVMKAGSDSLVVTNALTLDDAPPRFRR